MDFSELSDIEQLRALLDLYRQMNETNDRIIAQMKENEKKNEEIIKLQGEIIEIYKLHARGLLS